MTTYVITENGVAYFVGEDYHKGMTLEEAKQALEKLHSNWDGYDARFSYTPIVEFGTYFAQYHVSKKTDTIDQVRRYQITPYAQAKFE